MALPHSLSFYYWAIKCGISLWLVLVSCPAYVPSQDFVHLWPSSVGEDHWSHSVDVVGTLLSSSQKTGELSASQLLVQSTAL